MFDRRTNNIMIFKETEQMYKTNEVLKLSVRNSIANQQLILSDDVVEYEAIGGRAGIVDVSGKRTIEASEKYPRRGKRVCVLNFASATNPGGGVVHGSSAQEEAICRCTTLYPCLNTPKMWDGFYIPHREADNPLYNNDCIFTPSVKVFRADTGYPDLLPESAWWDVDVITCAAPNLRAVPSHWMNPHSGSKKAEITYEGLKALHRSRIQRIFEIAMANHVDVLILGAFGCGAFCNPPELVAEVFAEFTEKYRENFDVIEYAVYHTGSETANYKAFEDAMEKFIDI